ncbi:hypothetical protein D3C84_1014200 [compost metagenome]
MLRQLTLLLVELGQLALGTVDRAEQFAQRHILFASFGSGLGGLLRCLLFGGGLLTSCPLGIVVSVHDARLRGGILLPLGIAGGGSGRNSLGAGRDTIQRGLLCQAGGDHGVDAAGLLPGLLANLPELFIGG